MKLNPATLLVLIMFGSFVVILALMIAIFRPEPVRPHAKGRVVEKTTIDTGQSVRTLAVQTVQDTVQAVKKTKPVAETSPEQKKSVAPSADIQASTRVYRELEREKKEMMELRADVEKRLKAALAQQNERLKQLARRCEPLEPGEAVQILLPLSDGDIAKIVGYMQVDKAAPIVVLLKRNGRTKAVEKIK